MFEYIHRENLMLSIYAVYLSTLLIKILEKKAVEYMKWVFIGCIIFGLSRVLFYLETMSYVFEYFGQDISTPIFFINVFIGIIPVLVAFYLNKKSK